MEKIWIISKSLSIIPESICRICIHTELRVRPLPKNRFILLKIVFV